MKTISSSVLDLPGKKIQPRMADLDIQIRFDLWQDYQRWVEPQERENVWFSQDRVKAAGIKLEITLGQQQIYQQVLESFQTVSVNHRFLDQEPGPCHLAISVQNIDRLPVRTDNGTFVCGMFNVQAVLLQGIDLLPLLENTLYGQNFQIGLEIERPVYPWLLGRIDRLFHRKFSHLMPG